MPAIDRYAPGDFCWVELSTTNQNAAKRFYGALFGWTARDVPIGPNNFYSLMELDGRIAAGLYTMSTGEAAARIPSHWKLYVAVTNADDSTQKAEQLGAKIVDWPFDIRDRGRAAVIQDPTGAMFYLWEPKQRAGLGVMGDQGTFCWADLNTGDQARAKQFYEGLFGWNLKPGQGKDSGYLHIVNGENYIGGVPPVPSDGATNPPHWLSYFAVVDVEQTITKATDMNARILLQPTNIEGAGRIAILADPEGAVFALYQTI